MPEVCLVSKVWRSGTGWYVQLLAAAIAEAGARVVFVSPAAEPAGREPDHPNIRRVMVPREIVGAAPRARRVLASFRRSLTSVLRTLQARARTRVFAFSIPEPFPFTLPLFVLLRLTGARIVLVVHDPVPHAWRFAGALRTLERAAYGLSYRLADRLVVLAPAGRAVLRQEFAVPDAKISVIPHGPFATAPLPPMPGTGRLLAFGTIRSNKNVLETIKGVKLARMRGHAVRLLVMGEPHPHEPDYWEQCRREIAGDPEGFEVEQRFVADDDLPAYFGGVDAFVLAYDRFDSQSGVAILAVFSGRPVIATEVGGLGHLFQNGMAGETIAGDVDAESVASAIAAFRAVPVEVWRSRAEIGIERVSEAIGWPVVGRAFVELIAELEKR